MKKLFKLLGIIAIAAIIGFSITTCDDSNAFNDDYDYTTVLPTPPAPQGPLTPKPFTDITATKLVADIKVGWNLGNTLDAVKFGSNLPVSELETAWGNPVTTKENITAIKDAGFNAIRIPVSWTKCTDSDYNIREDWMARVTEIVNYAVENDMYILLNTHHDGYVFKLIGKDLTASINAFRKIWGQIACNFQNYDEKLIFEGLNEPRTSGSSDEWNGGTSGERANLNEYYNVFVKIVRSCGGNNNKRFLVINTYAASGLSTAMNGLKIPADTAQNKIIASYHAYEPYDFALNEKSNVKTWSKSSSADTSPITSRINQANNSFISNGIPVIIGEFGALDKNNESARAAWVEFYVQSAAQKGIKCFWWDNGGDFKIFDRINNTFNYPKIKNGLLRGAGVIQ